MSFEQDKLLAEAELAEGEARRVAPQRLRPRRTALAAAAAAAALALVGVAQLAPNASPVATQGSRSQRQPSVRGHTGIAAVIQAAEEKAKKEVAVDDAEAEAKDVKKSDDKMSDDKKSDDKESDDKKSDEVVTESAEEEVVVSTSSVEDVENDKAAATTEAAEAAASSTEAAASTTEAAEVDKAAKKEETTSKKPSSEDLPPEDQRGEAEAGGGDETDETATGQTAEALTKEEDKRNNGCAAAGASCMDSKCCQAPGHQCYKKDDWWAQCMDTCVAGPNVIDQSSPSPWKCEELGDRTPGKPSECSGDGEDCRSSKCCKQAGTQCFEKNENWAACRPDCTAGPNLFESKPNEWTCKAIGHRTPAAAPWVKEHCANGGEDCRAKGCCAAPGHQCYTQSPYYAKCRPDCEPGHKDNAWEPKWECNTIGMRTPDRFEGEGPAKGVVATWVSEKCSGEGENCLDSKCCKAVNQQCFTKSEFWANCKESCSTEPDPNDGNATWTCNTVGPRSWGLAIKGYPSLYCFSLFMPSSYEGPLLKSHIGANGGIFACDGYDVFANEDADLGKTKDGIEVKAIIIPKIAVGVSQDGTAGNAKLFMAVWDKVIAGNRFRDYDFTLKVDPDAVLIPWRIRDHMRPHIGQKAYVVNCNKFPSSPNFPMMFGAVEIFTSQAMIAYAMGSWKCGQQLPWGSWGEDYYMTHCLDFLGVGRIADFGVLGDNVCTGANCADQYTGSFHPFKTIDSWMQCWGKATR